MNALAVYRACQFAKEYTVSGKGPLVMEVSFIISTEKIKEKNKRFHCFNNIDNQILFFLYK